MLLRCSWWPAIWCRCQAASSVTPSSFWFSNGSNLTGISEKLQIWTMDTWQYILFFILEWLINVDLHKKTNKQKSHTFPSLTTVCRVMCLVQIQLPLWRLSASLPCKSRGHFVLTVLMWVPPPCVLSQLASVRDEALCWKSARQKLEGRVKSPWPHPRDDLFLLATHRNRLHIPD